MFVIAVSLAGEGIAEKLSIFKWILLPFPPITQVIIHFTDDALYGIAMDFWMDAMWIVVYIILAFILTIRLFIKKE